MTSASSVSAIADERRMTESNLWERSVKRMTTATIQRTKKKKKRAANCVFVAATEFCMCVCLRVLRVCVFFFSYSNRKIQTLRNVVERFFFLQTMLMLECACVCLFTTKNQYFSAFHFRKLVGHVKFLGVFAQNYLHLPSHSHLKCLFVDCQNCEAISLTFFIIFYVSVHRNSGLYSLYPYLF